MSNHFHLLVYVPKAPKLDDEVLLGRIATLYSGVRLAEIRKEWDMYVRLNDESHKKLFRARFFTSRYLTPLADAGYISVVGGENLHSPQRKYRLSVKGKRVVS